MGQLFDRLIVAMSIVIAGEAGQVDKAKRSTNSVCGSGGKPGSRSRHPDTLAAVTALDQIDEWPTPNVSAGSITGSGRIETSGDQNRPFALASVTKALFAFGVLVAIEEGTLTLDSAAGQSGSTVRHLLAHAAGYGFTHEDPVAEVGKRRIYSNAGFDVLADALSVAAGMPAQQYWTEAVAAPLGMSNTTIPGSVAHSGQSTVTDLLAFCAELLQPTLISSATLLQATTSQFPDLNGVVPGFGRQSPCPWGLGFELKGTKVPHWTGATNSGRTFGHFGAAGTLLWVDPVADISLVCLSDQAFGQWAVQRWPGFSDDVVASATT